MIEDWANLWERLWSVASSRQSHRKFISHEKKNQSPRLKIYKVNIARMVALFHQASLTRPAATGIDLETPCVCAWLHCSVLSPTSRSSSRPGARALPQELCQSKPSNVFWNSFCKSFPGDMQGFELELKLATTKFWRFVTWSKDKLQDLIHKFTISRRMWV